ncbi:hypothetical protein MTO96_033165 [Rhipicephalus appendiculatus]
MDSKDVKRKVLKGSRMPPLPKDETKIVVRPRGGLSIAKAGPTAVAEAIWFAAGIDATEREQDTMCPNPMQNVMVVSTPNHGNTLRYTAVESIVVAGQQHDVSAYVAAPHATCKGVIRGISNGDGPEVIERNIVNRRNPLALGAKRIKNTSAVVAFVRRLQGSELCRLRRHPPSGALSTESRWTYVTPAAVLDIAPTCVRLRMKPYAGVVVNLTRASNTGATQSANYVAAVTLLPPRSARGDSKRPTLSGADGGERMSNVERDNRSKSPSRDAAGQHFPNTTEECSDSRDRDLKAPSGSRDRSRSRGRRSFRSRSRSRGRSTSKEKRVRIESKSRSRSRSRSKGPQQRLTRRRPGSPTWADTVRQGKGPAKVGSGSPPEHVAESASRIAQLERENALMQETNNKLMSEIYGN